MLSTRACREGKGNPKILFRIKLSEPRAKEEQQKLSGYYLTGGEKGKREETIFEKNMEGQGRPEKQGWDPSQRERQEKLPTTCLHNDTRMPLPSAGSQGKMGRVLIEANRPQ